MRKFLFLAYFILLGLLMFALLVACGDDDDDDSHNDDDQADDDQTDDDVSTDDDVTPDDDDDSAPPIDEWLIEGKQFLAAGEYASAYDAYKSVLSVQPQNTEALFGETLAHLQHMFGMIDMVFGLITPMASDGVTPDKSASKAQDSYISQLLATALTNLRTMTEEQLLRLETLQTAPDFTFTLPAYPLRWARNDIADLHSEWDAADVYVLSAFYHTLDALLCLLDSQSFEGQLDMIEDLFTDGGDIFAALATLLIDNPDLLTIRDGGEDIWNDSAASFTAAAGDMLQAATLMAAESDDQSDDVFAQNPSLAIDGVEHFALQGKFASGSEQVLLLWHGKKLSVRDTLTRIQNNMNGQADSRLRLEDDLVMLIGVGADFALKGIGIKTLLQLLAPILDKQALTEAGIAKEANGERLPALIITLLPLLGVPKDAIEFDVGAFYSRPFPLRELAPNTGADPFSGDTTFLQSYECARLGFAAETFTPGDTVSVLLNDRGPAADATGGPGNDAVTIQVFSLISSGSLAAIDTETLTLNEDSIIEAYFTEALPTSSETATPEDGTLQLTAGDSVLAVYYDESGDEIIEINAVIETDGEVADVFSYGMGCQSGTARDYDHFTQDEFSVAYYLADPPDNLTPLSPYPTSAADGIAGALPYLAFKTGSFNGLLWLNMKNLIDGSPGTWGFPNGFSIADERMTNVLVQRIGEIVEQF